MVGSAAESSKAELIKMARSKLDMDVANNHNFAFTGQSGCGKSTLINAIRSLTDEDPGAAHVGETEVTTEITKYLHPAAPHLALWDIPGAGTLKQPENTYFRENMLYAFDLILILSADRFLDIDFQIAVQAKEYSKPFAFVRTKADLSLRAMVRRNKKLTMLEASEILTEQVTANLHKCARIYGLGEDDCNLFIVSAWALRNKRAYANKTDTSLEEMDEEDLVQFVFDAVEYRA